MAFDETEQSQVKHVIANFNRPFGSHTNLSHYLENTLNTSKILIVLLFLALQVRG